MGRKPETGAGQYKDLAVMLQAKSEDQLSHEKAWLLAARSKKAKQASRSPRARCASSWTATTRSLRWTRTTWRRPTLPLSTGWRISPNYVILMRALFFTPFDRGTATT